MSEFIVGLDVSKRFHVAYTASQRKPFTFVHSRDGFEKFQAWLTAVAPGQTPILGVEPTGQFTKVLVNFLLQQNYCVMTVPGVFVRRAKFFLTSNALKTDAVDARVIAELVSKGHCTPYRTHHQIYADLRQLSEMSHRISLMWGDMLNRTHTFVDVVFPELTLLHKQLSTRTPRELLKAYPNADAIAAEDTRVFLDFIWRVSRGKVTIERSLQLHETAKQSIGLRSAGIDFELKTSLMLLDQFEQIRTDIEQEMDMLLQQIPYATCLKTIPGFGTVTTSVLLGLLGNLRDYPTEHHLLKACGLSLIQHASGSYKSNHRISKMGNPTLRRYLYQASVSACCLKDSPFREWYEARIVTKPVKVVLVACMRRLVRISFAMARDGVPFDRNRYRPTPDHPKEFGETKNSDAIIGEVCA